MKFTKKLYEGATLYGNDMYVKDIDVLPDATEVKNPRLKSRASDSPSGFFSLATRLRLPFYLLSCFICPMHCLPAVSYSDSLSASLR